MNQVARNSRLDWFTPGPSQHPVFGRVVEGCDLVRVRVRFRVRVGVRVRVRVRVRPRRRGVRPG